MGKIYGVINGPAPTAGAVTPKVATGATIKTLIQLATSATREIRVVQHYITMDAFVAAQPVQYELSSADNLTTPATVTAYAAADIRKVNDPNAVASTVALGINASGFTASAEGTYTTPFTIEQQLVSPTAGIYIQYPQGREAEVRVSSLLRQRVTAPATVNAITGVMWEE